MNDSPTRVFVVDTSPLIRDGLKARLGFMPGLSVSGEANDLKEAMDQPMGATDIVLVDIDSDWGVEDDLAAFVDHVAPALVLVLGWDAPAADIQRSLAAGTRGYMLKDSPAQELSVAISTVRSGGTYFGQGVVFRKLRGDEVTAELTAREREVMVFVGQGLPSKTIADRLNLSVRTVESHRTNVKRKLRLRSNGELIKYAVERAAGSRKVKPVRAVADLSCVVRR
ncbi:response regulator transcription factor [Piscinibacter gummiphilus]|uniref:Response regulator transcription factor n=1 Tax=Piscinibacter gummiphilus TaxID=946333 RepID=A0ABZ0CYX6_9BURK|nr:response regulator transcription factor [Piscinibacter gummiphilus]WOB10103.1 response regulator transcription factor [Piscinibacter gummiphilus]